MTDLATADPNPSTVIDDMPAPAASGGGAPSVPAEEPKDEKPISIRDSLEKAAKDVASKPDPEAETPKDEKPEVKPKAEEVAKEEPKAEGAQEGEAEEPKPSEGKKPSVEPPARLLPKHRDLWKHVPHDLRVELDRLSKEDEGERTRLTEQTQRYSEVAEFDELARSNGGSLKQSLERVRALEDMMGQNPIAALNQILLQAGPRKPDGQPYSLFEIASAIAQGGPQQYQQLVQQQPQRQQSQADPRVQQLEQEVATMRVAQLQNQIIEPFKAAHPRYDELSPYIASFLETDIVPKSLSPDQRLAHAYDMAERLYPVQQDTKIEANDTDRGGMSNGSKSIKSTPGSVSDSYDDGNRKVSIRDAIEAAAKKQALRG